MADARIYFRYSGSTSWGTPQGTGSSKGKDANSAKDHAERQAWREAQKGLQAWYDGTHQNFAGQRAQVKIWVDNLVCPQCQLWMIAGVLRNLAKFEFKPQLFVEVKNSGGTQATDEVTRNYVWPVNVGHAGFETLAKLKAFPVQMVDD